MRYRAKPMKAADMRQIQIHPDTRAWEIRNMNKLYREGNLVIDCASVAGAVIRHERGKNVRTK